VIPEIEEVIRSKRKLLIKVVFAGTIIPAVVYLVFGLGVFLISGAATTTDALSGLVAWSPKLVRTGALVGILATFTSFLSLSNVLKEVLYRDVKTNPKLAKILSLSPSFVAIFASSRWFLQTISLTGSITVGFSGIIVCLISLKANGEKAWHKPILYLAIAVLFLGMTTPFWK
jgi:hypothetical protein